MVLVWVAALPRAPKLLGSMPQQTAVCNALHSCGGFAAAGKRRPLTHACLLNRLSICCLPLFACLFIQSYAEVPLTLALGLTTTASALLDLLPSEVVDRCMALRHFRLVGARLCWQAFGSLGSCWRRFLDFPLMHSGLAGAAADASVLWQNSQRYLLGCSRPLWGLVWRQRVS